MNRRVVPNATPRKIHLDSGTNSATSAAPARFAQPRIEPEAVFEPMRVPRVQVRKLREADLVVDMDTVPLRSTEAGVAVADTPPVEPEPPPEAVVVASQARLAARIRRVREMVADLRLDIEAVRRS